MKISIKLKSAIIPALAAVLLCSCGSNTSPDEMRQVLGELLPKAEEMNVIYFGEGLPMTEEADVLKEFYDSFDYDVESVNYQPVDPSCGYENETQLREATLEVFTEGYSEYLFELAFSGISAVYAEGTETEYKMTSSYATYLEQNGILTARIDLADEAIQLGRTYDLAGLEIVLEKENYVVVSVPSEMNGKQLDVELKIVKTEAGWRLDSPTY